jgi:hypothetical protein
MTLLELTMVLGLGLAIVTGALTQSFQQLQSLRNYREVEYYARDVPKVATALGRVCRGADSLTITTGVTAGINDINYPPGSAAAGVITGQDNVVKGTILTIKGKERTGTDTFVDVTTDIWMAKYDKLHKASGTIFTDGSDRWQDKTGAYDFAGNQWQLIIKKKRGAWDFTTPGWVLCENIANVEFQYIPGTDGAVLMTVWRQEKAGEGAKIAFELVLERK